MSDLATRIADFIANAYHPSNLDSTPEKLRKALALLSEVVDENAR